MSMSFVSVNSARPCRVSTPTDARSLSRLPGAGSVNPRFCCIKSAQLIDNPAGSMPLPVISRALSMISAPRRRIFFGSQPRSAHVPP